MVQRNLGLSFLPQYVVENSLWQDRLHILRVRDFRMHMYRQLFYHKDKWLTQAMKYSFSWLSGKILRKTGRNPRFSGNPEEDPCTEGGSMI